MALNNSIKRFIVRYFRSVDGFALHLVSDITISTISAISNTDSNGNSTYGLYFVKTEGGKLEPFLSTNDINLVVQNIFGENGFSSLAETPPVLDVFLCGLMDALCKEISTGKSVVELRDVVERGANTINGYIHDMPVTSSKYFRNLRRL